MQRNLFGSILGLSVAACGGDASLTPTAVAGTWELMAVEGKPLPYLMPVSELGNRFQMVDDEMNVSLSGVFAQKGHTRAVGVDGRALPVPVDMKGHALVPDGSYLYNGAYTLGGSSVAFVLPNGTTHAGVVSGTQMTITMPNATFVYQKR